MEYFCHYYEKSAGPFKNLSALPLNEAERIQEQIRNNRNLFASRRNSDYVKRRQELEQTAYRVFRKKGGRPRSLYPHYFVLEKCPWLESWYENPACFRIPTESVPSEIVSFSYGDLFPSFSDKVHDGKEYRKQIYTLDEIGGIIKKYGLPQKWNPDGKLGPERYIEVHIWIDDPRELLKKRC